ncbi:MAG: hypothetical protein ACO29C_01670, partial [Fluviibacter sp.]
ASALGVLNGVKAPTLLLMPRNDPFLTDACYPQTCPASVTLETPATGGHVGFSGGHGATKDMWLPSRIINFFAQSIGLTNTVADN